MKALRIILEQSSANYRKEETQANRMTYPLPPFSTVIGALHNACGFEEYKDMKISIQGNYDSLKIKYFSVPTFLNSVLDDRGTLVKMVNSDALSNAFTKVASARVQQRNASYKKGENIQVYNKALYEEYNNLANEKESVSTKRKELKEQLKNTVKKSDEHKNIKRKLEEIGNKYKEVTEKLSMYKCVEMCQGRIEILHNIKLVIHIAADDEILDCIYRNALNIKSIGRSEDFIDLLDAEIIDLKQKNKGDDIIGIQHAYLNYMDILQGNIVSANGGNITGTKFMLNKNYYIEDEKRIFDKVKVIYSSEYKVKNYNDNIWIDKTETDKYIVNFS